MVPVMKQRTTIKQPPKWKVWKKAQRVTEFYNTHEEQLSYKLILECCPGYMQVESGLCEPICDRGCPAYASCVAPQRCQCTRGYISAVAHRDGSHYCEPICERGCLIGSQCVAPNTCACKDGFKSLPPNGDAISAPCEPICTLGDGCANGQCVDVERCVCNRGYQWSEESSTCVANTDVQEESNDDFTELRDYLSSTAKATTFASVVAADCEDGFVFYSGECRAELFESNEPSAVKDCRQFDCGPNQSCSEQGNCICNAGYVEVLADDEDVKKNSTLSCRPSLFDQLLGIDETTDDEDELNSLTILIVGMATVVLLMIVILGLLGGMRRLRGQPETEPREQTLQCEFTQKSYDLDESVP
ncbi:GH11135 [Drosophila grimshawi]|uniref:GH11135 n=2 Tax=Drosophila grimshawi TaxID=7222 RepID=B4JD76_DROGR|nr:GH11135 [Drosophila grimshawi]